MTDKPLSLLKKIGHQHYQESHGLHYDDFTVGDIYEHRPGRTITEADNTWQSLINLNTHPLHIDHAYAATTAFGKPLVSSLVTFSIIGGLSLASTSARAIANLGWNNIKLLKPVFIGDTLYARSTVMAKRPSATRPGEGIVTIQTHGLNQHQKTVLSWERSFLISLKTDD
ncbi:MaoC family dehydratase [Biostraticola tofi]|uniref:Itaconyl-CoA hydratase n=1 Tax=Biostraticola tofi TaxID=466109 RepID=A0A4R3YQ02_9GAMM|nr:MaoC family dehydratase [Biostraticola tofi]TCV94461.1 itaconyl-CoA hydratase [Biostraticola tofi]